MKGRVYRALSSAAQAFKAIAVAATELQIYTGRHPRFQETLRWADRTIQEYFNRQPESDHLTYIVKRGQCEFRRVPLLNLGSQGERLTKSLTEKGAAGLQLRRSITPEEIQLLLQFLIRRSAPTSEGCDSPHDSGPESKFRLLSEEDARKLESGEAKEVQEEADLIHEFLVSQACIQSVLDSYRTLMSNLEQGGAVDLETIQEATGQAIALLAGSDRFFLPSLSMGYFDDFTFHHSVNVCLFTMQAASSVIEDKETLSRVALAALLHDVGKCRVPPEILHKSAKLTDAEFRCMQSHPVHGAEILLGVNDIDPLCVSVAFAHHMSNSPSSYPKAHVPIQYDSITELVAVVDVYEALTAARPYKKGLSPEKAFNVMLAMPGLQNRLPTVKLLYDTFGPYPAGTYVQLSTGERAVVLEPNRKRPGCPRVRVLTDDRGNRLSERLEVDLGSPDGGRPGDGSGTCITRTILCRDPDDDPLEVEPDPEPKEILGERLESDSTLMAREG